MEKDLRGERLSYRVPPAEDGFTIQNLLRTRLGLSRGLVRRLKAHGQISVNGIPARTCDRVVAGDEVDLILWASRPSGVTPEPARLEVVAEDEDILVVNKPAGMVSHPVRNHVSGTLANAVAHYLLAQGHQAPVRLVSRLDKNTSGLVLVARNSYAHQNLNRQMEHGWIEKKYLAVVHNAIQPAEGVINAPICRVPGHPVKRMVATEPGQAGKPATTHYRMLKHWDKVATLLELSLATGRTHQIRVHLSHIGHPLVGDDLYGANSTSLSGTIDTLIERQALHACNLAFDHPRTGTRLHFTAELPEDMRTLIAHLDHTV